MIKKINGISFQNIKSCFKTVVFWSLLLYFIVTLLLYVNYLSNVENLLYKWENGDIQDYYIEFSFKYRIPASQLSKLKIKRCKSYFDTLDYHSSQRPDHIKRLGTCDMKLLFPPDYNKLEFLFGNGGPAEYKCSVMSCFYEDGVLVAVPFFDDNDKAGSHFISWDCENSIKSCPAFKRFMQAITLKKEHDDEENKEHQERMKKIKEQERMTL